MIMKKIILIIGGERSGKSSFAEQAALSLSPNPVYLATAQPRHDCYIRVPSSELQNFLVP